MRRNKHWVAALGLSLGLLAPGAALAQTAPTGVVISDALLALGVSSDAGLAEAGTGLKFTPTSADGLANLCACSGWNLVLGDAPLVESVEDFTFSPVGASSVVHVQDAAGGTQLRVTHDFHPAAGSANLYEVVVTVENLGTATVQPAYSRTVGWTAGPGVPFQAGLPPVEPGATQVLRLYFGAGTTVAEAGSGLGVYGAKVVSQTAVDTTTFVFGYADGAAPVVAGGNAGGGGGGNGGGGGGGGGGGNAGGGGGGRPSSQVNRTVPVTDAPVVHALAPLVGKSKPSTDTTQPNPGNSPLDPGQADRGTHDIHGQADQAGDSKDVGTGTQDAGTSNSNHDANGNSDGNHVVSGNSDGSRVVNGNSNGNHDANGNSNSNSNSIGNYDAKSDGGVDHDSGNFGNGTGNDGPSPTLNATPELDSLALMGTGLMGLGGYTLLRLRARRPLKRRDERLDAKDQD